MKGVKRLNAFITELPELSRLAASEAQRNLERR